MPAGTPSLTACCPATGRMGRACTIETLAELIGDTPKVAFDHYGKEWGNTIKIRCGRRLGKSQSPIASANVAAVPPVSQSLRLVQEAEPRKARQGKQKEFEAD